MKAHLYSVVYTSRNKRFQSNLYLSHTRKDLFFRVHSHAFNSVIFTLLCENQKLSLIYSDAVAEITELWGAELLDSLILINVVPGINVLTEITELWVEYSQKIVVTSRYFGKERYIKVPKNNIRELLAKPQMKYQFWKVCFGNI